MIVALDIKANINKRKYKKLNNMQAVSQKVSKKYKERFRENHGSMKAFAEWSGLHYNTARYFRTQFVIDKANEFLKIMKEEEKQQLSKSIQ
jgi:hypothetical protein